jgi:penicillin G amidase
MKFGVETMTRMESDALLRRLGAGEPIARVAADAGLSREQFDVWWNEECRRRVPPSTGSRNFDGLEQAVEIRRDRWGIPHVKAANDRDLFFAFGYATAQDRLFQFDYLRRKARGRLAEILGAAAIDADVLSRTIGLSDIAEAEWPTLSGETQSLLAAYAAGINALLEDSRENLPIEFALLDYRPEAWKPTDSLAIMGEFRWYLTGRFPVIVVPELAKRTLGDGPLYRAFLEGEADDESIMQPGSYAAAGISAMAPEWVGQTVSDQDGGQGSNNWVVSGSRTASGKPIVASDPHVPFGAVSMWHEIHLQGGSFDVVGVAVVGMPAILLGRNRRVAWGITNNICSQRDLYQEKTDPAHPDCFLFDGRWEPAKRREERILVRGGEHVTKIVRSSRNGPIVDEILPAAARSTGPVSVRWLGAQPCGWLPALIGMNRAGSCDEFREASRPWLVPTFNVVFADVDGHVAHQSVGRIPLRRIATRGYRPGWDPEHQWAGLIPFEGMPHQADPASGLIVTANNRLAPNDYPYPLSGTWSGGYRARRIRQRLEALSQVTAEACQELQQDVRSERAAGVVPQLLALLDGAGDPRVPQAAERLAAWDFHVERDSVAATIFNVFYDHWRRAVVAERFPGELVDAIEPNAAGLATALLTEDRSGWFHRHERRAAVQAAFLAAIEDLTRRFGPEMSQWTWGRLHTLLQKHFLSGRGELGALLDRSGLAVGGDGNTVASTSPDATYGAWLGDGYRMVSDMADLRLGLSQVEVGSASGHPGSPHYDDQLPIWAAGGYHYLALQAPVDAVAVLELRPR